MLLLIINRKSDMESPAALLDLTSSDIEKASSSKITHISISQKGAELGHICH